MRFEDQEKDAAYLAKVRETDRLCEDDCTDDRFWEKFLYGGTEAQKETFVSYCRAVSNWGMRKHLLSEPLRTAVPQTLLPAHIRQQCRERGEIVFFWLNLLPPGDPMFEDDSTFDRAAYGEMFEPDGSRRPAAEEELRAVLWHAAQLSDGEHLDRCSNDFQHFMAGFWRSRWPYFDGRPLSLTTVEEWQAFAASKWRLYPRITRIAAFLGINLVRVSARIERFRLMLAGCRFGL